MGNKARYLYLPLVKKSSTSVPPTDGNKAQIALYMNAHIQDYADVVFFIHLFIVILHRVHQVNYRTLFYFTIFFIFQIVL